MQGTAELQHKLGLYKVLIDVAGARTSVLPGCPRLLAAGLASSGILEMMLQELAAPVDAVRVCACALVPWPAGMSHS